MATSAVTRQCPNSHQSYRQSQESPRSTTHRHQKRDIQRLGEATGKVKVKIKIKVKGKDKDEGKDKGKDKSWDWAWDWAWDCQLSTTTYYATGCRLTNRANSRTPHSQRRHQ